jgi:hypothetical protein
MLGLSGMNNLALQKFIDLSTAARLKNAINAGREENIKFTLIPHGHPHRVDPLLCSKLKRYEFLTLVQ